MSSVDEGVLSVLIQCICVSVGTWDGVSSSVPLRWKLHEEVLCLTVYVCTYVRSVNDIDGVMVDVLQEKKWSLSLQS